MCGIIGFYANQVTLEHIQIVTKLTQESKIRGLHAFGCAWTENSIVDAKKWFQYPQESFFNRFNDMQDFNLIWHNRYSTSGDWKNMMNNQPITNYPKKNSIVMNGVITMLPWDEWEPTFKVGLKTENDAEIFLRIMEQGGDVVDFVKNNGSFAGIYLKRGELYALRNDMRPLHWFRDCGAIFIVSTVDIVDRSYQRMGRNGPKVNSVTPNEIYCIKDMM